MAYGRGVERVFKDLLPAAIAADFDARLTAWRTANPGGDVAGFLASLHASGKLSTERLCALIGALDVEVANGVGGSEARELGVLGRGAMGEVVLARDERLNRHVAVKRMLGGAQRDPEDDRRFQQEVQIMAQLDHPAIVPVYGIETGADGLSAYAMKLIRGETLAEYLASIIKNYRAGREPDEDHALPARLNVFLQVCNAIHYAHTRGVIHRDLKPSNIMIGAFGEVLVLDWGIARLIGRGPEVQPAEGGPANTAVDASGTMIGRAIGTPSYMSPEQANGGNATLDGRSDQYALGLILHEIVSLQRAITGKNSAHVMFRAMNGERDPLEHAVENVAIPRELAAIVAKATSARPEDRYADVDALADDVRRYLRDDAVLAAPDGLRQRLARWIARHREATLGVVFGLVLLVMAVIGVGAVATWGLVETHRYRAAVRQEALTGVVTGVSAQASRIDDGFQGYEALLTGLEYATEYALRVEPPADARPYAPADLTTSGTVRKSTAYFAEISPVHAMVWRSPGASGPALKHRAAQLASLEPELARVVFASGPPAVAHLGPSEQQALLVDRGLPMIWAYVTTEDGLMVAFPGALDYPGDYEPRDESWYKSALGRHRVAWDPAGRDASDKAAVGMLVSATTGVWEGDRCVGVAAIDIAIGHILDDLLAPPGLAVPVDTWLVDDHGRTIATSTARDGDPPPFPFPGVLAAAASGRAAGSIEVDDPHGTLLVTWAHLGALNWTYAVVGPEVGLLGRE